MARIRTVKPELWQDEALARVSRDSRLLFIGLFNVADDVGRLRGAPAFIAGQVFPYDEDVSVRDLLDELESGGFIQRYEVDAQRYVFITNFTKHQKIDHPGKSKLPEPLAKTSRKTREPLAKVIEKRTGDQGSGIREQGRDQGTGNRETVPVAVATGAPPLVLIPDRRKADETSGVPTWEAYSGAYRTRYGAEPVRNATTNAQIKQLVKRLGAEEAPPVAAFFLTHSGQFYVSKGHAVGMLLADCEKLRTEWATGRQVTATAARQQDKSAANANGWASMLKGES